MATVTEPESLPVVRMQCPACRKDVELDLNLSHAGQGNDGHSPQRVQTRPNKRPRNSDQKDTSEVLAEDTGGKRPARPAGSSNGQPLPKATIRAPPERPRPQSESITSLFHRLFQQLGENRATMKENRETIKEQGETIKRFERSELIGIRDMLHFLGDLLRKQVGLPTSEPQQQVRTEGYELPENLVDLAKMHLPRSTDNEGFKSARPSEAHMNAVPQMVSVMLKGDHRFRSARNENVHEMDWPEVDIHFSAFKARGARKRMMDEFRIRDKYMPHVKAVEKWIEHLRAVYPSPSEPREGERGESGASKAPEGGATESGCDVETKDSDGPSQRTAHTEDEEGQSAKSSRSSSSDAASLSNRSCSDFAGVSKHGAHGPPHRG